MLNVNAPLERIGYVRDDPRSPDSIDLDRWLSAIRRQKWMVFSGAFLGLSLGIAHALTAVPLYTSTTKILIDKNRAQVVDPTSGRGDAAQNESEILSQVEIFKSDELARAVVSRLKLTTDGEFLADTPSILSAGTAYVKEFIARVVIEPLGGLPVVSDADNSPDAIAMRAIDRLQQNLTVDRVGRTFVLTIGYTAPSPRLAARISQEFGDAYIDDQLQAKYDATKRASVWLQDRIADLKLQSFEADLQVQKFRAENNLIAADGRLVSEQQMSEITTQLIGAQAATAESKAKLDQIQNLINSGRTDAVVDDSLVSSTIINLRERYLDASRQRSEIESKLGPNHVQVVRLKNQMDDLERLIFGELRRIGDSYRSSYNVALSRQSSLEKSLKDIVSINAESNTTQVQLRELERESETLRALYSSFLEKFQGALQQQSFPISDARVISPAAAPLEPSFPRKTLLVALSLMLGTLGGVSVGAIREYKDRYFRIGSDVSDDLNLDFLGYLPIIKAGYHAPVAGGKVAGDGLWRSGSINLPVQRDALSPFAETLRNVRVSVDNALPKDRGCKVLGVVSCLPNEGKTTVAANFGVLLASHGRRVLLIDGDIRKPAISAGLLANPQRGLAEALSDGTDFDKIPLIWDATQRLAILPTMPTRRFSQNSELLSSPHMENIINSARREFDYVVIDLPPVGLVVDAKAIATKLDLVVFVIEWGKTPRHLVRSLLASVPSLYQKCIGVVFNKADSSGIRRYHSPGSLESYSSKYSDYYFDKNAL